MRSGLHGPGSGTLRRLLLLFSLLTLALAACQTPATERSEATPEAVPTVAVADTKSVSAEIKALTARITNHVLMTTEEVDEVAERSVAYHPPGA
jgi:hypothetical protein